MKPRHALGFRDRAAEQKAVDEANAQMEAMFGDLREAKGRPMPAKPSYLPKPRPPRGGGDTRSATDIDRVHRNRATPESEILSAVTDLLCAHPKTVFVCRQNSGMASYEAKTGRYAPVHFYKILKAPSKMTIVDVWGLLNDGRMFAVETKNSAWIRPSNDREERQAAFLALIRKHGGIGIFATDAQQVAEALR